IHGHGSNVLPALFSQALAAIVLEAVSGVSRRRGVGCIEIGGVRVVLHDALQSAELGAFVQRDQRHALRGAAQFADLGHAGAHQHAGIGDQHDLVVGMHQRGGHDLAVALALLDGDHALGATAVAGVLGDRSALAVTVDRGGQHALLLVHGHQHGNHALAVLDHHAAHASGVAAHGADIVFVETHGLATVTEQHH